MRKSYLFPTYFQKIGWIITLPLLAWLLIQLIFKVDLDFDFKMPALITGEGFFKTEIKYFAMTETMLISTVFPVLFIIGLSFIAFAKRKDEDEYIGKIREQSLVWSLIVGYCCYIFLTLFIYGLIYLYVKAFVIYIFLILFICKFNYELYRLKKALCKCEDEQANEEKNVANCKCKDCDCV
jgi:amino acid transporter